MNDGNNDQPTRDAKGRWLKGHCPNPKGRPRKSAQSDYDPGDLRDFGSTLIEVNVSGQRTLMDRRAALLHKTYESAMKGSVSNQRFLIKEFERNDGRLAAAQFRYEELMTEWVIENPGFKGFDDENIPFKTQLEIAGLESLLNHYYPGSYPDKRFPNREIDSDVGDG